MSNDHLAFEEIKHQARQTILRGKRQGYLSLQDIVNLTNETSLDDEHLMKIIDAVENLGIKVVEDDSAAHLEDEHEWNAERESSRNPDLSESILAQILWEDSNTLRLLTKEEEQMLARRIEHGDKDARRILVQHNIRLVISIANQYMNRGVSLEDLIQEGLLGLLKAIDKFDYRKGFKFSTYATWWIRQAIVRAVSEQGRILRIPVHTTDIINRIYRTRNQFVQDHGREPTPEELASILSLPVDKVLEYIRLSQHHMELDKPLGEKEDSNLFNIIPSESSDAPQEVSLRNEMRDAIMEVLSTLDPKEAKVIAMRFGLLDGREYTLEEVGEALGVTRERARQIENRAIRRLRHPSRSQKLIDFLQALSSQ